MSDWKDIREKINRMHGAPPDADPLELTEEEQRLFVEAACKPGVLVSRDMMILRALTGPIEGIDLGCSVCIHKFVEEANDVLAGMGCTCRYLIYDTDGVTNVDVIDTEGEDETE